MIAMMVLSKLRYRGSTSTAGIRSVATVHKQIFVFKERLHRLETQGNDRLILINIAFKRLWLYGRKGSQWRQLDMAWWAMRSSVLKPRVSQVGSGRGVVSDLVWHGRLVFHHMDILLLISVIQRLMGSYMTDQFIWAGEPLVAAQLCTVMRLLARVDSNVSCAMLEAEERLWAHGAFVSSSAVLWRRRGRARFLSREWLSMGLVKDGRHMRHGLKRERDSEWGTGRKEGWYWNVTDQ